MARKLPRLLLAAALGCSSCRHDEHQAVSAPTAASAAAPQERRVDAAYFGANGQDDEDDTLAIQAAIAAARGVPLAEVVLAAGTYYLSDQAPLDQVCLRVDNARRMTLSGAGEARTRLVLRGPRDAHMISISDSEAVTVSGLSIDGTRAGRKDTHGVRVASSRDVALRALDIRSTAHYGIGLQYGALRRIRIEHVRIDDTGGDGVDFKNTAAENDELLLRDVRVSRPGQAAPRQAGLDIRGRAQLEDVQVTEVPEGATGIRFREDGPETGPGGHDSTLTDFLVQGERGSTGVAVAADRVRVTDGRIVGTDTGVDVLGVAAHIERVVVSGARFGFRIETVARGSRLFACRAESNRAGVWLEGSLAALSGCVFAHNQGCGVCLRPGATGNDVSNNQFLDNAATIEDLSAESGGK